MAAPKSLALFFAVCIAFAAAVPIPEPGGFGKKHTHYIIHVPYEVKVHTVHHHHIKKVPVYIKEHHHEEHHEEHHDDHSSHGWDWD